MSPMSRQAKACFLRASTRPIPLLTCSFASHARVCQIDEAYETDLAGTSRCLTGTDRPIVYKMNADVAVIGVILSCCGVRLRPRFG